MIKTVIEYLKKCIETNPNKIAFFDNETAMTYCDLYETTTSIAHSLVKKNIRKKNIAVYMDKSAEMISAFLGSVYSGNCYSPLDTKMPLNRIELILETLKPAAIITEKKHYEEVQGFHSMAEIIVLEESKKEPVNINVVEKAYQQVIDTDLMYILFTSGSTGVPKGVMISHKSLIDFIEWGASYLNISEDYIFGNQTPFYFSMSVFDIYQTLKNCASMYIISQAMFSLPVDLMKRLDENKVNTLFWVPSALTLLSSFRLLDSPHLSCLKNIFFGGEAMQISHLNKWKKSYPFARYINFYGPTETTDTCAVFEVNREFLEGESLPIGNACNNKEILLLDEENQIAKNGEIGEICVRGTGLSYGYYRNIGKTEEAFVQNPLNNEYKEIIYKTGDLAKENEYGEFVYMGRKDYQIKHMGHRIELGEIENAAYSNSNIEDACCIYDDNRKKIVLFYTGEPEEKSIKEHIKKRLPEYMVPNRIIWIEEMPHNINGKMDRKKLKQQL